MCRHIDDLRDLLFGETSLGVLGCSLQWLVLAAIAVDWSSGPAMPIAARVVFTVFGVGAVLASIILAVRGDAQGPILVVPALLGLGSLVIAAAVLSPLKYQHRVKREGELYGR